MKQIFRAVAAPGLRIFFLGGGAFEGQTHIFWGGQDIIFKKVLLFAHAVVTGLLSPPPPQEIRPPLKRGDIPRNTAPGGQIS